MATGFGGATYTPPARDSNSSYAISNAKNAKTGKNYTYTDAEWAAWYEKKAQKKGTRNYKGKKTYTKKQWRKRGGGGRRAGQSIVYPNVIGSGPYYLQGGLDFGKYGNLRGGYYSSDVNTKLLTGSGPYLVKRNSLTGSIDVNSETPIIHNGRTGEAVIISNHEYLGELVSSEFTDPTGGPSAFKLQTWQINPGNSALFPWLSAIAQNFQEYEIRGMIAYVKTMSTDYSSTVQLGTVFGASDYNLYNADPTNKQQVEMLEYSNSCKPSRSLVLPIECEPANNGNCHKYIAMDGNYNGGDKNLYDWGNLYIGSQGLPATDAPIGEIWITYEVAFFKPILKQNVIDPLYHCLAAQYTWTNCSVSAQWGDGLQIQKQGKGFEHAYAGDVFQLDFPVTTQDYVYQVLNYVRGGVGLTPYDVSYIYFVEDMTYAPPIDYDALQIFSNSTSNSYSFSAFASSVIEKWVLVPAGRKCRLEWNSSAQSYAGQTNVGKNLIIQGFNTQQCGFMVLPANGVIPSALEAKIPLLQHEKQLKSMFQQWLAEQKPDSSSSSSDEAASSEIETVIQRLQSKLDEQRGKKQVTFT